MKILFDPTPGEGGGGPAPESPPPPATISLPREEAERLFATSRELETLRAQATEAQRVAREQEGFAAAEKGEREKLQKLLGERDEAAAKVRDKWLNEAKGRAIADALAGKTFTSEAAAAQAAKLLGDDIEAILDGDTPLVRDRKFGRPAAETIAERLASPEFAHFLKPSSQGGTGATDRQPAGQAPRRPGSIAEAEAQANERAKAFKFGASNPFAFGA